MKHIPKKSLGQNFLKSEAALRKIIEVGEITPNDIVLEIGPGKGVLTKKLLEKANQVIAVEKDKNLFLLLQEKFQKEISHKKLILVEEDILEFDLEKLEQGFLNGLAEPKARKTEDLKKTCAPVFPNYKIIANIPYNITGAILKKFLTEKFQPKMMVLMVQNEVAKRIIARDKKESILSVSVKTYGTPKLEMKVPARYFSPAPKVDSAIISIKNISRNFFIENKIQENKFWEIVHAGFAHKRKKLFSNLKKSLKLDEEMKKNYEKILGNKRSEELSLTDWLLLTKNQ